MAASKTTKASKVAAAKRSMARLDKKAAVAKKTTTRKKAAPPSEAPELGDSPALAGLLPPPLDDEGWMLKPTRTPGVFLNRMGVLVDKDGSALALKDVLRRDKADLSEVAGATVDTPAKLLKAVSMDPRLPLGLRVDAAKSAAPYFDRKQPQAIDGGVNPDGTVVPLLDAGKLQGLSDKELQQLRVLLEKAGGTPAQGD